MSNSWLQIQSPNPDASLRLFCFPFAGGSAQAFKGWSDSLPKGVEVCAVQFPGREMRQRETPISDVHVMIEALAPALVPWMDRPFVLFGHSMGALVAYELARKLEHEGRYVPEGLIVSGRVAAHRSLTRDAINHLPSDEFIDGLRRLNGTPEEVLSDKGLMSLIEPMLRADLAVHENYVFTEEPRLQCDVLAFGGLRDSEAGRGDVEAWRELTDGGFSMQMMPGEHFFIRSAQGMFLRALSIELRRMMSRGVRASVEREAVETIHG